MICTEIPQTMDGELLETVMTSSFPLSNKNWTYLEFRNFK